MGCYWVAAGEVIVAGASGGMCVVRRGGVEEGWWSSQSMIGKGRAKFKLGTD